MKYALLIGFLAAGIIHADEAANKKLLKELEGKYTPTAMIRAGDPGPKEILESVSFEIKGDAFIVTFKADGKEDSKTATIVVDAEQKPASIDLTPKDGPEAGKPMLGIVVIEKDAVKLCWSDSKVRTDRPKEFKSTKENGCFYIEMKKAK